MNQTDSRWFLRVKASCFLFVAGVILFSEPQATAIVMYVQTSCGSELQHFQSFEAQLPIPPAAAIRKHAETAKNHQVKIMSPQNFLCWVISVASSECGPTGSEEGGMCQTVAARWKSEEGESHLQSPCADMQHK